MRAMEGEEAAGWRLSLVSCKAMDWLALKPSASLSKSAGASADGKLGGASGGELDDPPG